ncbi:SapB/AmfS family lanthipeptide [Kitasatospora sp. NPDC093806]
MEILELQALEAPAEEVRPTDPSSLSVVNCGNSTVSTILCL